MTDLNASILPFSSSSGNSETIEIYVVTGKHGFLGIPKKYCKECDMFYQAAKSASKDLEEEINIEVKSYWTRFLRPLLKGGIHPPVMLIDGNIVSQGYEVPSPDEIIDEIKQE